jgi:hypothetical protein
MMKMKMKMEASEILKTYKICLREMIASINFNHYLRMKKNKGSSQ